MIKSSKDYVLVYVYIYIYIYIYMYIYVLVSWTVREFKGQKIDQNEK